MWVDFIILLAGFVCLAWGADRLVEGASALARNLGVSPLLVGLTIVALGTSLPEMFVAAQASLKSNTGLAIGNVIGSNIANIGLVLGIAGLCHPLEIHSRLLEREFVILLGVMVLALGLLFNGVFSRVEGLVLVGALLGFLVWLVRAGLRDQKDELMAEYAEEIPSDMPMWKAWLWLVVGLVTLPIASRYLVQAAVDIAHALGVSDFIIGLTIIAIGTSLPEVATAIAAAFKKEYDIVMGNVLGSNLFNLLAVLPIPALIAPGKLPAHLIQRDVFSMFLITFLLLGLVYRRGKVGLLGRGKALLLILSYVGYLGWLMQSI